VTEVVAALIVVVLLTPRDPLEVHLDDLARFPSYAVAADRHTFAEDHLEWVFQRFVEDPAWRDWWDHARSSEQAWSHLVQARNNSMPDATRLFYLRELRKRLGERAWWSGEMPPQAPVCRFSCRN
jgi:hypothetical protein